jgi:putative SOS response-associated peptidase YedK
MGMCGRYVVFTDTEYDEIQSIIDEVSKEYKTSESIAKGEVFPTNTAPIIYEHKGKTVLTSMKWSYGQYSGRPIINARSETINSKNMFQSSFHQRRCLIPANAYFEWKKEEDTKKKTKFKISIPQYELFFMAGIYNVFKDNNGKQYTGYAIITTSANQTTASVHDRMPVIIEHGSEKLWIGQGSENTDPLIDMLKPYTYKDMIMNAVS